MNEIMIFPRPSVSSFRLSQVEAFSVARVYNGELQYMTDIYTTSGCEFYHGKNINDAAVFNPNDLVAVGWDDEMHALDDFFAFWSDDVIPCLFFPRKKEEINWRP